MAFFNHRILLPTNESNYDDPCPPQCDFSCPGCPPPSLDPQSNQNQEISPLVIIIVAILGSCFLIVSYYAIIVKYCSSWIYSRRRAPQSADTHVHEEFPDEDHGPVVDHPIWFITTVGLEQSIINSIAVCKYKKGDGLVEGTECSVCLNDFQEDETLRFLPKCNHAFHIPCIDTWLRSHTNCPLCRAHIVSNPVGSTSTDSVPNLNDSGLREETQVENSENDSGLVSDENRDGGMSDPIMGIQCEEELHNGTRDIEIEKEGVPSPPQNCDIRVLSDLGENHLVIENVIRPVRRSVSLDFSMFCFSVANFLTVDADENSPAQVGGKISNLEIISKNAEVSPRKFRMMGSSSKGRLLEKESVSIKRSFSSRSIRNQISILPL